MSAQYWVIVVSKDHVQRGVENGCTQANHGKAAALRRMRKGDGVLFYSPKIRYGGNESCQCFTALGTVRDDGLYQANMGNGFEPWRRNIDFLLSEDVSIMPLIDQLQCIKNKKRWGYVFRWGFFEIPQTDFLLVAERMTSHTSVEVVT
jgi:hypothetical protein